ncbi:MAG: GAF domain-containing protein, partial [Deltaproteobacteria bacterium]|nr:GAF domain-containing protein [Deltaproteobacteria bacterium]
MERGLDEETVGGEPPWARQSRLFGAICWTAQELFSRHDSGKVVAPVLARLGRAAGASGGFVVAPAPGEEEPPLDLRYAWTEGPACELPVRGSALARWAEVLRNGDLVRGAAEGLPRAEREALLAAGVRSVLVAPVFTTEGWWGGVGLDSRKEPRDWDEVDVEALRTLAALLGGALDRELFHQRARAGLESRVRERIAELLEVNAALVREISECRRAEGALEQQAQALARSNAELEQFAYVASHDLQQPLVAVIGFLKLLEQRYGPDLDDDGRTFIDQSLEGANRMQLLIRDLLDYSRHSGGEPLRAVDCEALLEEALQNLRRSVEESGASVTRDPLPTVVAAPTQLARILQNLLDNALKFAQGKPPRVHVSASCREGEWLFSVSDNGIGIAPADRERIFHIFERLHGGSKYPGTGIGLAI